MVSEWREQTTSWERRCAAGAVDLRTVQELGGWKQISMVERYSHLSAEHKADAVEKIAQPPTNPRSESEAVATG